MLACFHTAPLLPPLTSYQTITLFINTSSSGAQPTLLSFLTGQKQVDTDLALALDALASSCKKVSLAVRRAPIERLTGYLGSSTNVGGERQKKLDVLSDELILEGLGASGRVAGYASEEQDGVVRLTAGAPLVVACDPLDGSSNVDCSVPTGTIFGVYRALGQDDDARAFAWLWWCLCLRLVD